MTEPLTDLKAALRKACEDAAIECHPSNTSSRAVLTGTEVARIFERHLTPLFEALRISVIEECAEIARPVDDVLAGVILKLKGAPR